MPPAKPQPLPFRGLASQELPAIVEANFPIKPGYQSICGHSMGGHGALTIAMKNPVG
jgi:S-formylglutathione hydrolase FrmB